MPPNLNRKSLLRLSIAIFLTCISCSKPHDGNLNGTPPPDPGDQKLQPFSAQIVFAQPDQAIVSWSASRDSLNDTIRYKILLAGKIVDSDLTRLTDTLKGISPGLSYAGSVLAYNRYNDTISATFKLGFSSKGYAYYYTPYAIRCADIYTNQLVWTCTAGGYGIPFTGTPVVVNDTLYANYDDIASVYAINATTGNIIWNSGNLFSSPNETGPSLSDGGPVYSNGKVYVNSSSGIYCLNSTTGQVLWYNGNGIDDYYTTPVVDGGKVFVGTYTYHYTGIPDTFAYKAIDGNTGATIWKQLTTESTAYPIACNGVVIFNDLQGNFTALDQNTGSQIWTKGIGAYFNNAIHYNNLLICWANGQLCGLDISTGAIVWQVQGNQYSKSDPLISHDTIFVAQELNTTTVINQFQLLAVRAGTGELLWKNTTPENQSSALSAIAGGRIYMYAIGNQSLNVYSTKDGSFMQSVNADGGAIVINGTSYYSAASGMVQ